MEQRLARSRCYRCVFVFEHFFYSSADLIVVGIFSIVNKIVLNFIYFYTGLVTTDRWMLVCTCIITIYFFAIEHIYNH